MPLLCHYEIQFNATPVISTRRERALRNINFWSRVHSSLVATVEKSCFIRQLELHISRTRASYVASIRSTARLASSRSFASNARKSLRNIVSKLVVPTHGHQ